MSKKEKPIDLFEKFKRQLLNIDPISFCQNYLTLDGSPFSIEGNGYKPFSDIYRYIGIKALEPNSKPTIIIKGRQVGGTTLASALEMYFCCSGNFGTMGKPPVRIIHAFPQSEMAQKYTKEKLNPMINSSVASEVKDNKGQFKSYIQTLLDSSSDTNNSLSFKQFVGGNYIRIDSTGLDGGRLRGGTADVIFYDECFPYNQKIETSDGPIEIGKLFDLFSENQKLPTVKSYNEKTNVFENKEIINVWKRERKKLIKVILSNNSEFTCTPNHKFLTLNGWKEIDSLKNQTIRASYNNSNYLSEFLLIKDIVEIDDYKEVYDIEVKSNHNFVLNLDNCYPIAHNCQDISGEAIGNTVEMLKQAKYGRQPGGVQVYFGTPKKKGSDFNRMWNVSSQQYFHLGCEKCKEYFPLYTPESDDWKTIWIRGFIVKCPKCNFEQDKREAAERGKWVSTNDINDPKIIFVGFHINQFYMPKIKREDIDAETPGVHPTNTERKFRNEVLGEFFHGDASPITTEEIIDLCGDRERKFRARINPGEEQMVVLGIDYGARSDLEQIARPDKRDQQGRSYTTAVIMTVKGPNLFSIDLALKFQRNDPESKKGIIDNLMRQYSVDLCIGDIGFSQDFSYNMHVSYGDKYLVSRAQSKINDKVKFDKDMYPKEIKFERDHYIAEIFDLLKKGQIRFPLGDYDRVSWLINHCTSMELKPTISKYGDPTIHYVKGGTPNDGFMALLNAYLAYKFILTKGFTDLNPFLQQINIKEKSRPLAINGYVPRRL